MVNLVGKEGFQGPVFYQNIDQILGMEGVCPHIYGKKRPAHLKKWATSLSSIQSLPMHVKLAQQVKESH